MTSPARRTQSAKASSVRPRRETAAKGRPASTSAQSGRGAPDKFSKSELYMMWKVSERELQTKLEAATRQNDRLRARVAELEQRRDRSQQETEL